MKFQGLTVSLAFIVAANAAWAAPLETTLSTLYERPTRVAIHGYNGDAMEPCISMDGLYLFFNNSNEVPDTHLHVARRVGDVEFQYMGPVFGTRFAPANARPSWDEREMAPSMDLDGEFFFTAIHSYRADRKTLWKGKWTEGRRTGRSAPTPSSAVVTNVSVVQGMTPNEPWWVDMDCGVSPDGKTLVYSRTRREPNKSIPVVSDLVLTERTADGAFRTHPNNAGLMQRINTPLLEYAPTITNDALELYYTQADPTKGVFRTMVATRRSKSEPFSQPWQLTAITGFAEAPSMTPDKWELYFHKKDGNRFQIYRVTRDPKRMK